MPMYNEIVKKYYTVILNYCLYKLNGNLTSAEDVTQEVFLTLYKKLHRLRISDDIKYWLYKTADYEIKTYLRKNPSCLFEVDNNEMLSEDSYPSFSESDFECLTQEEINLLNDYYGEKREQVIEKNECSSNAMYIKIHRIKKKLVDNLSKTRKIKL